MMYTPNFTNRLLNLYSTMALVYGVTETGKKCKIFRTEPADYFSVLHQTRRIVLFREIWDILVRKHHKQ